MAAVTPTSLSSTSCPPDNHISSEVWERVERVTRAIFIGELVLLASTAIAMGSLGCFAAVVFYQATLKMPAVVFLVMSAVLGAIGQEMIQAGEMEKKNWMRPSPAQVASIQGPPGLWNEGNTCFMNATFQMIMNDVELCRALKESFEKQIQHHQALLQSEGDKAQVPKIQTELAGFQAFIAAEAAYRLAEQSKVSVVPMQGGGWFSRGSLLSPLRNLMPNHSHGYTQADASEFLQALFHWVKESDYPDLFTKRSIKKKWEPFASFRTVALTLDPMPESLCTMGPPEWSCVLPIGNWSAGDDGQALLDHAFNWSESIPGDPAVYQKGLFKEVQSCYVFDSPPQRIILSLKRFEFDGYSKKINTPLHMKPQMTIGGLPYELTSIVHHSGSAGGGHYTSYNLKNGQWWHISDSFVRPVSDIEKGLNTGYLYFFRKIESQA